MNEKEVQGLINVVKVNVVVEDIRSKLCYLLKMADAQVEGKAKDLAKKDIMNLIEDSTMYLSRIKILMGFGEDALAIADDEFKIFTIADFLSDNPCESVKKLLDIGD